MLKLQTVLYIYICSVFLSFLSAYEHTVVKGDTLWDIAQKYYNNPFLWKKIYETNKDKILNPDLIYPGQRFKIPSIVQEPSPRPEPVTLISEETRKEHEVTETAIEETTVEENKITTQFYTEPTFVSPLKKFFLGEKDIHGKIISGKENKFLYLDGDIMICQLIKDIKILPGDIMYIYHIGPSKYDTDLLNVPRNQANLVGKMRVLEVNKNNFSGIITKIYSPIIKGDILLKY